MFLVETMQKLELNGIWKLSCGFTERIIPANVPGDIADDLRRANLIGDPYYGYNYQKEKWIHDFDYEYEKDFIVDSQVLNHDIIELVFEGIDTFSEISVNGKLCLKTDSMHLTYRIDVKNLLKEGKNNVRVLIKSVNNELKEITNSKYESIFNSKRIFVRKAQCHFGWDWAPDFMGSGIYRDVYLSAKNKDNIKNVNIITRKNGNVTFKVELNNRDVNAGFLTLKIAEDPECNKWIYIRQRVEGAKNIINVKIKNPKLWWPNGYGEQNLYLYELSLETEGIIRDIKQGCL